MEKIVKYDKEYVGLILSLDDIHEITEIFKEYGFNYTISYKNIKINQKDNIEELLFENPNFITGILLNATKNRNSITVSIQKSYASLYTYDNEIEEIYVVISRINDLLLDHENVIYHIFDSKICFSIIILLVLLIDLMIMVCVPKEEQFQLIFSIGILIPVLMGLIDFNITKNKIIIQQNTLINKIKKTSSRIIIDVIVIIIATYLCNLLL